MVRINTTATNGSYTDFTALVEAICGTKSVTVLYRTDGSTYFDAYAYTDDAGIHMAISGTKPGAFDTDFPDAVQVPVTYVIDFS